MAPKKFYAVARGRKPGIYYNWSDAKQQIDSFPGALYKGFTSFDEAEAWLKSPGGTLKSSAAQNPTGIHDSAGRIIIYSDGGSSGNPGPGGYGAVILSEEGKRELSGGFRLTTNNRMELTGVITALQNIGKTELPVEVYTDSSYVVNGITKGWAKGWRKRGWIKSDKTPALNPDLWGKLLDLIEPLTVTFHWVKGHAGNPLNERCDELAVSAAKGNDLPADSGYKG